MRKLTDSGNERTATEISSTKELVEERFWVNITESVTLEGGPK